jgi:hypothetical protein
MTETVTFRHACKATKQNLLERFVEKPSTGDVCRQPRLQTAELVGRLRVNACMQPGECLQALRYEARTPLSCAGQTISPLHGRIRYPSARQPRARPRPPEPEAPSPLLPRGSPPRGIPWGFSPRSDRASRREIPARIPRPRFRPRAIGRWSRSSYAAPAVTLGEHSPSARHGLARGAATIYPPPVLHRRPTAGDGGRRVLARAEFGHEISREVSVECRHRCLVGGRGTEPDEAGLRLGGLHFVGGKLAAEAPVDALVEQHPHETVSISRSFASSRNAMTCSRVTDGNPSRKSSIVSPASM